MPNKPITALPSRLMVARITPAKAKAVRGFGILTGLQDGAARPPARIGFGSSNVLAPALARATEDRVAPAGVGKPGRNARTVQPARPVVARVETFR